MHGKKLKKAGISAVLAGLLLIVARRADAKSRRDRADISYFEGLVERTKRTASLLPKE